MKGRRKLKNNPSILFITNSAYSLGGLATWLDYQMPGLKKREWSVTLGLPDGKWHNAHKYLEQHPYNSVEFIRNRTGTREGRIRALCKLIGRKNPDILAVVNMPDVYAAVGRLRSNRMISSRVVMTLHGIQADLYDDIKANRTVLDGVVCTNKLACRLSEVRGGIEKNRIYYAPYGVEIAGKPARREKDSVFRILYAGRLEEHQKRVRDITSICERLETRKIDFKLYVAGSGPDERKFRNSFRTPSLKEKMHFLGIISRRELLDKWYGYCDVLLLTSLWETGPLVLWEALANDLPVVTSAYVGSSLEGSLRNERNCLIFPVGDIECAVSSLLKVLDPRVRNTIIENGQRLIEEKYSTDISISELDRAFRLILEKPARDDVGGGPEIQGYNRLDKIFGVSAAETLRELLGKSFVHSCPGGEWPHSHGKTAIDTDEFWDLAASLDKNKE